MSETNVKTGEVFFKEWYIRYIARCDIKYENIINEKTSHFAEIEQNLLKLVNMRNQYTDMSAPYPALDAKIEDNNRQMRSLENTIQEIEKIRKDMLEKLSVQSARNVYKKLMQHPKIEKVQVATHSISIITKMIRVQGYEIGNFQIYYDYESNVIKIKNLVYCVKNCYDHWHVKETDPCLGDWKNVLVRYADTYQLFLFVDTLIHYLLLSDSSHAYIQFDEWLECFQKRDNVEQVKEIDEDELVRVGYGAVISQDWGWSGYTSLSI